MLEGWDSSTTHHQHLHLPRSPLRAVSRGWLRPRNGRAGGLGGTVSSLRTADAHGQFSEVFAYPTGVSITVFIKMRPKPRPPGERPNFLASPLHQVVFGIELSDGSKAFTTPGFGPPDKAPPRLSLRKVGGGANDTRTHIQLWLWPLPPPGPLTLGVRWPEGGIPEATVTGSSEALLAAAEDAEHLWAEPEESIQNS